MLAAKGGRADVVKLLVDAGTDKNTMNQVGFFRAKQTSMFYKPAAALPP
jgi:hypothetical protein